MQIDIRHNFAEISKKLESLQKQATFATAVALTRAAQTVRQAEEREVEKVFDRPTAFTKRGFRTRSATKSSLVAEVYILPRQAAYLAPQIFGGPRERKRFEQRLASDIEGERTGFFVPGPGIKLSASGNLTRGQVAKIAQGLKLRNQRRQIFAGSPGGLAFGIWERSGRRGLKPLLIEVAQPRYTKKFDFFGLGKRVAIEVFPREFNRAMADALRTAR